jgi:hypothetical protein
VEEFVELLAQAFCLDIHDFTNVMIERKQVRRACATIAVLGGMGVHSIEYHTLKMAMALFDTSGFFLDIIN